MTPQRRDNIDAIVWIMISNSLDIDFIHGHIHGRSCKKLQCHKARYAMLWTVWHKCINVTPMACLTLLSLFIFIFNVLGKIHFAYLFLFPLRHSSVKILRIHDFRLRKIKLKKMIPHVYHIFVIWIYASYAYISIMNASSRVSMLRHPNTFRKPHFPGERTACYIHPITLQPGRDGRALNGILATRCSISIKDHS